MVLRFWRRFLDAATARVMVFDRAIGDGRRAAWVTALIFPAMLAVFGAVVVLEHLIGPGAVQIGALVLWIAALLAAWIWSDPARH